MGYKTLAVELENGRVRPHGTETLPSKAQALLTLLDSHEPAPSITCEELAERWMRVERLPEDEARSFADDLAAARVQVPDLKSAWD